MSNKVPPEEDRFYQNTMALSDYMRELAEICWEAGCKKVNPQMIGIAKVYLSGLNKIELIDTYIKHANSFWEQIRNREEVFFLENAHAIFQKLPVKSDNINAFKVFMTAKDSNGDPIIEEEDKDVIWDYFSAMTKIAIKYIHRQRRPKRIQKPEGYKVVYTNKFFPEIDVRSLSRKWNIELTLP